MTITILQWNPDFPNPRFFEPWHVSHGFASVKPVILPSIFRNSRYFEPILASLDILFLKLNQKLVN